MRADRRVCAVDAPPEVLLIRKLRLAIKKPLLYPRAQETGLVQLRRFRGGVGFPLAHLIAHIEQFDLL
jgi:hypothetical protein